MKQIPVLLQTDFDQGTRTTCLLMRVFTKTNVLLGFTDLDVGVTYDPAAYDPHGTGDAWGSAVHRSDNGFMPKRIQTTADLSVDNTDLQGWISDTGITEAQIRAGLFDKARVRVYRVNYMSLGHGHELCFTGTLGQTKFSRNGWTTEFRSFMQQVRQQMSYLYSLSCKKQFGSKPFGTGGEQPEEEFPCGKDWVWVPYTVTSVDVNEPERKFTASAMVEGAEWYEPGVLRATSGSNTGAEMEVEAFDSGGVITGMLPLPYPATVGMTFLIRQDCNKIGRLGDCKVKHNNYPKFGGEEDIPVADGGQLMVPGALIRR